jgi:hypothetical protein
LKVEVVFEEGEEEPTAEREERRLRKGKERTTSLTEFFKLCRTCPEAREYTYATVAQKYWWSKNNKVWNLRKRKCQKLVRIGSVAPGNLEAQVNIFISLNFYIKIENYRPFAYYFLQSKAQHILMI